MKKVLYTSIGLLICFLLYISFLSKVPEPTIVRPTIPREDYNSGVIDDYVGEEDYPDYESDTGSLDQVENGYIVKNKDLEGYIVSKEIKYGKLNPMYYIKKVINIGKEGDLLAESGVEGGASTGNMNNSNSSGSEIDWINDNKGTDKDLDYPTSNESIQPQEPIKPLEPTKPPGSNAPEESTKPQESNTGGSPQEQEVANSVNKEPNVVFIMGQNIPIFYLKDDNALIDWKQMSVQKFVEEYNKQYSEMLGRSVLGYNTQSKLGEKVDLGLIYGKYLEEVKTPLSNDIFNIVCNFGLSIDALKENAGNSFSTKLLLANITANEQKIENISKGVLKEINKVMTKYDVVVKHDDLEICYTGLSRVVEDLVVGSEINKGQTLGYIKGKSEWVEQVDTEVGIEMDIKGVKINPLIFINPKEPTKIEQVK